MRLIIAWSTVVAVPVACSSAVQPEAQAPTAATSPRVVAAPAPNTATLTLPSATRAPAPSTPTAPPVMLHHGTADTTVDEGASVAIAETLRMAGKEVTLYLYEGSGHALQGAAYDRYAERTLRFFQTHLGARAVSGMMLP